jgi:SET domain-containing protein
MNNLLKENVFVKESPIHGKGCFAARNIKKGEFIGTYEGTSARKDGIYVLWVLKEDGDYRGVNGKNALRFLNHSQTCNSEFEGQDLYAVRRIKKGEEITFDYGEEWEDVP